MNVPILALTANRNDLYRRHQVDVSKAALARRLGLDEKEARRMRDPKHAAVPALERALLVLGKRVELVVV